MSALYGLAYTKSALDFLKSNLPPKHRRQIIKRINKLPKDPYPQGCKKLKGTKASDEDIFRAASGDYRILYTVRDGPQQIVILDIGPRKDIYRNL